MPLIPGLKTFLSVLLLSVIVGSPVAAADALRVYRFGGWTLLAPADVTPDVLSPAPYLAPMPLEGMEFLAYWQDGKERALALRFSGIEAKQDAIALQSFRSTSLLKGCTFGARGRIKPLKDVLPKDAEALAFPDGGALQLVGSERGLRRNGDILVADLGSARVQITADSPVVRVGEWNSADFCRFELHLKSVGGEDD